MSLNTNQKAEIKHLILVGHASTACIASRLNVDKSEVAKYRKKLRRERSEIKKAETELEKLTKAAKYDRPKNQDSGCGQPEARAVSVVGVIVTIAMALVIVAMVFLGVRK